MSSQQDRPSSDSRLRNMDTTVVALPLLEKVSEGGTQKHPVIIEVNLLSSMGGERTKERVTELVKSISGASAVNEQLSVDSEQYVFANLSSKEIQRLCVLNERGRDGRSDVESRKLRPIYKIWPDFDVEMQLSESVSTVKADAARVAFAASGRGIVWAVIDSGIQGKHPHFRHHQNLQLPSPLAHWDFTSDEPREIRNPYDLSDPAGHGTHVAGIIAGENKSESSPLRARVFTRDGVGDPTIETLNLSEIRGVAPECKLVSLRVTDGEGRTRASRILAALALIRRINGDGRLARIHGVNISLGHSFEPEWFACGQSPLCVEVDRLVRSGTVVVVAAGNGGFGTVNSKFKEHMQAGLHSTLLDPANARMAITVGSTHRNMPHIYGVSYFSAKGPTGDGRLKPDLVAPGEKIISCSSNACDDGCEYVESSGTSMAAPHVSGCIAGFLSIRREFKNQPERIKEIFMETATDLGRERYFQGSGLIDLMRAIQSV
ncbi:S8 family peptidase [Rhodopirellula sp. MGV]|uniref:S8 family peptidase n=1 Tax=Rhodopirellula sp. MGV TaxID=2023130 RepID=UPI000B97372D|nr:S8 family peptidase [Rhodopirellula sp. MGV]OYP35372.1 hypothetical protein CGZ80_11930 [Rhodopirellula sp. MGV]PNY37740.1 peptidase S8/S53 subtilisin kexin sedolisin [Rhodopirellula baltica]